MSSWLSVLIVLSALRFIEANQKSSYRFPIVYVFTVVEAVCNRGLPVYIKESLEQAVLTQPDCEVILASNYATCPKIAEVVEGIQGVTKIDVSTHVSARTKAFVNVSENMFAVDGGAELWLTSAFRFFYLEDLMIRYNMSELMHVEADNLLYGKVSEMVPDFRQQYRNIAATPLTANLVFITASIFWVAKLSALQQFNDYLLQLGENGKMWLSFLDWIRPHACCKHGGIQQDEHGMGIRPYAVNEMSMLGYYHQLFPAKFKLVPVVPTYPFQLNKYICDLYSFAPEGKKTGGPIREGIWDPNSWGQFLGGTATKRGKDRQFSDATHIAGQAMRTNGCRPHMMCANKTMFWEQTYAKGLAADPKMGCLTAPFVDCKVPYEDHPEDALLAPLYNLHVHSKNTHEFRSVPCECPSPIL